MVKASVSASWLGDVSTHRSNSWININMNQGMDMQMLKVDHDGKWCVGQWLALTPVSSIALGSEAFVHGWLLPCSPLAI